MIYGLHASCHSAQGEGQASEEASLQGGDAKQGRQAAPLPRSPAQLTLTPTAQVLLPAPSSGE